VHLRTITAAGLIAVPLLGGCGSAAGDDGSAGGPRPAPGTTAASAPVTPASSTPPAPTGPVIDGASYSIVLPAKSKVVKGAVEWSRAFERGWNLEGQLIEAPCGCRTANDDAGLDRLVEERTRHDKLSYADVRRAADVTIAGYRFAHVTASGHSADGGDHVDDYVAWYAGRSLDFAFTIHGAGARYAKLRALVDQSLATVRLKS